MQQILWALRQGDLKCSWWMTGGGEKKSEGLHLSNCLRIVIQTCNQDYVSHDLKNFFEVNTGMSCLETSKKHFSLIYWQDMKWRTRRSIGPSGDLKNLNTKLTLIFTYFTVVISNNCPSFSFSPPKPICN